VATTADQEDALRSDVASHLERHHSPEASAADIGTLCHWQAFSEPASEASETLPVRRLNPRRDDQVRQHSPLGVEEPRVGSQARKERDGRGHSAGPARSPRYPSNTKIGCKRRLDKGPREVRANRPPLVSCNWLACLSRNTKTLQCLGHIWSEENRDPCETPIAASDGPRDAAAPTACARPLTLAWLQGQRLRLEAFWM